MGLFGAIKSIASAVTIPFRAGELTQKVGEIVKSPVLTTIGKTENIIQKTIGAVAGGVSAVGLGAGSLLTTGGSALAKQAITKPIQTAKIGLGLAVGVPVVYGAVKTSPTLQSAIIQSPSKALSTGERIGEFIEGTREKEDLSARDILKTGAVVAGGAGLLAGGAYLAYDYLKDRKKDEQVPEQKALIDAIPDGVAKGDNEFTGVQQGGSGIPTTPTKTPSTRKKSKKTYKTIPSVNVRVTNKNYINAKAYAKAWA